MGRGRSAATGSPAHPARKKKRPGAASRLPRPFPKSGLQIGRRRIRCLFAGHLGHQHRLSCLEPLLELLGTASCCRREGTPIRLNQEASLPHFPVYTVLLQRTFEPLESQCDRLLVPDDNPNSHHCASCTADAMPRYREPDETKAGEPCDSTVILACYAARQLI